MFSTATQSFDTPISKRAVSTHARRGRPVKGSLRADGTEWVGAVEAIQKFSPSYFAELAAATSNVINKARYTALQRLTEGATLAVVAAEYSVSTQTVSSWAGRFRDGGSALLEAMQGSVSIVRRQGEAAALREMAAAAEDMVRKTALVALAEVVEGKSVKDASGDHRFVHTQFVDWVERFNSFGLDGIDESTVAPAFRLPPIVMRHDYDMDAVTGALDGCDDPVLQARIMIIAMLYEGREPGDICSETGVSTTAIRYWADRFNRDGLAALAPSVPGSELRDDFDASRVEEIGAGSDDSDVKRRCRAIADIYGGRRKLDIAEEAGITRAALHLWCKRFNERGEKWLLGDVVKPWSYQKADAAEGLDLTPAVLLKTEINDDDVVRISECLARCLRHSEPLAPGMVKTWIRMELDVLLDGVALEAALARSGYGVLRGKVVEKAVSDRYTTRKAARESKKGHLVIE
ncbi:helix-turn-helix domain-containing protein [Pararhizobium sp. BT-229]|uniref:helix-turn-helix domain-containing protein n=1 Tax=Pararhizobium sp. BT-229 TaxID=2986923 RepID=UPI0021F7D606|nr:helix-turn-helix domain-containing protein [Pararhizobium sp. BT-229]MCV9964943.1 helix-turn-helix domain-containing protein [Pararhizobium sp. BT-229]